MKNHLNLRIALTLLLTVSSYGQHPTDDGKGLRYEAEEAELSPVNRVINGLVNEMHQEDASCLFTVDGGKGGMFDLIICYAAGTDHSSLELIVNEESKPISFPMSGSWEETATLEMTAKLNPGSENKIEFKRNKNGANLDYIELRPAK
jgi:hypothetical protein